MMKKILFPIWAVLLIFAFAPCAKAQEKQSFNGVPADVYYLMPHFSDGVVYLRGQRPLQGKMNICAVDNTLRYLDQQGQELTATQDQDIVKVRIDSVLFLRSQNIFYRLYPLSGAMGVALRRDVQILRDVKEGAYGSMSQTTSVQSFGTIYSDGALHNLESGKVYPYTAKDLIYIYTEETIYPLTRKSLRKLFPARKDEIDAWFKTGHNLPETAEEALAFLSHWTD